MKSWANLLKVQSNRQVIIFFFINLLAYGYFFHFTDANSNSRFDLTLALVEKGTVSINAFHDHPEWGTDDKSFYNRNYFSDKAPGTSFLGAIIYFPIYHLAKALGGFLSVPATRIIITFFSIALTSALCASMVFAVAREISQNASTAFWSSIAITLGTMFWPYSNTFYGHPLVGTLLFTAFYIGFRVFRHEVPPKNKSLFLIGLALGFAFITEYIVAVIIIWILGYLFYQAQNKHMLFRAFILIGIGSLISMIPALVYNYFAFGSPFSIGYSHLPDTRFGSKMGQGLMGIGLPSIRVLIYMTLHPAQGILWMSPALIFILPGFINGLAGKFKLENILAVGILITMLVTVSGYFMWWGGWAFAPRHLIPLIPFMVIPLASLSEKFKPFLIPATIVSGLQMFLVTSITLFVPDWWHLKISFKHPFEYSTIYSYILPGFLDAKLGDNLAKIFFAGSFLTLAPFVFLEIILFIMFYRSAK